MALRDGLYRVHFQTPMGEGNGVAVLEGGRLRGGDSMIYYVGTYKQDGDRFTAEVQTDEHSNMQGMASVFGVSKASITIQGKTGNDTAEMTGSSPQAPGVAFKASLHRLHD